MTLPDDIKAVVKAAIELCNTWSGEYVPGLIEASEDKFEAIVNALSPDSLKMIEDA